ncbi:Protein SDA1 [Globomyces sp. JEL0801]|nr:Protein SDA1 [Globomyces sp. JEL0801]
MPKFYMAAKKSLEVMIELYQKNIWNDAKTVNVVSEACLSQSPKLVAPALHFFLGTNDNKGDEDEDMDDLPDLLRMRQANSHNKKRKSRAAQMDKAQAAVRRRERNKNRVEHFNFSALHLLNDPQGFTESLFSKLKQVTSKNTFNFELRLEMMNLISRLIGVHKLLILGFYDFIISYIKPHQKDVTQILAYLAQASHDLIPPDALENTVRAVADNFVWSNCASEVIAAGLNALREVCTRCPLAMPEELLKSLMEDYKNHRDKGPMNAARALLGLYRDFNPQMLKKKDRGKAASINLKNHTVKEYGHVAVYSDVADAELLEENSDLESEFDEDADDKFIGKSKSSKRKMVEEEEDSDTAPELVPIDGAENGDEWEDEEEDDDVESELDWDNAVEVDDNEVDAILNEDGSEDSQSEEVVKPQEPSPKKIKLGLASQKIFTDEDFAIIRERREQREINDLAGVRRRRNTLQADDSDDDPNVVDANKIMAFTRKKDDYEARMNSIKEGRIGREYGSKRGKDERSSTTNREKAKKNKPMTMLVHKRSVKSKKSRSLMEKQKVLRAHITKQKKKGH